MDDLKKLSVDRLRALARKHLGKGHSRLRTKAQLLEALKDVAREPLSRLLDAAESVVSSGRSRVRVVDFPPGRRGRVRSERTRGDAPAPSRAPEQRAAAPQTPPAGPGRALRTPTKAPGRTTPQLAARPLPARNGGRGGGERVRPPPTRPAGSGGSAARNGPPGPRGALPGPETQMRREVEALTPVESPVEEGFFQSTAVPRRTRRAPSPPELLEREPLTSPGEVGTDAPLLLVRDPSTLFVFWDFRRELERGAALGLREPRLLLRLYRGPDLDRSLELPLTARSTYVTGLTPGQEYTAEVLLLGRDGWTRPVGSRSAVRRLPPGRVSTQLEVRTLRLPWSEPLAGTTAPSAPSAHRHEPLDSPRRVPLPSSPGARGPAGGPGASGGPRSGRN